MDNKSARGLTIAGMTVHISPPRKPMPTKIPTRKKPLLNEKAKDKIYNALMSDPAKKKMVLDLIRDNKDKIEEYARKERIASMNKVMKTFTFESPTALQKRKALEKQQKQQKLNFNNEAASSSNATSTTPKTPKKILLKGVHAYVEVTGPGGLDKSEPFKQMLISMGATISTSLHKHCTHVIYKDGTFETYKKGRRLKKYVVSILWLDAVNRTGVHVPEKNYPALGDYDSKFASDDLCDKLTNNRRTISDSLISNSNRELNVSRRNTLVPSHTLRVDDDLLQLMSSDIENDDVFEDDSSNSQIVTPNMITTRRKTQRKVSPDSFHFCTSDDSDVLSDVPLISGSPNRKSLGELVSSKELNDTVLKSSRTSSIKTNKTRNSSRTLKALDQNKELCDTTPISQKKRATSVTSRNKENARKSCLVFDSPLSGKTLSSISEDFQSSSPKTLRKRKTLLPMEALNGVVEDTKLSVVDMELTQASDSSDSNLNATAIKKYSRRRTIHCNDSMELTNNISKSSKDSNKIRSNLSFKSSNNAQSKINNNRENMHLESHSELSNISGKDNDSPESENIDTIMKNVVTRPSLSISRTSVQEKDSVTIPSNHKFKSPNNTQSKSNNRKENMRPESHSEVTNIFGNNNDQAETDNIDLIMKNVIKRPSISSTRTSVEENDDSIKILSIHKFKSPNNAQAKINNKRENMCFKSHSEVSENTESSVTNMTKRLSMSSTRTSRSDRLETFNQTRITRRMSKQLSLHNSNQSVATDQILRMQISNTQDIHTEVIDTKRKISAGTEISLRISDKSNATDMSPLQLSVQSSNNKSHTNKVTPDKNTSSRSSDASSLSSINSRANLFCNAEIPTSNNVEKDLTTSISLLTSDSLFAGSKVNSHFKGNKQISSLLASDESYMSVGSKTNCEFTGNQLSHSKMSLLNKNGKPSDKCEVNNRKSDSPITKNKLSKQLKDASTMSKHLKTDLPLTQGKYLRTYSTSNSTEEFQINSSESVDSSTANPTPPKTRTKRKLCNPDDAHGDKRDNEPAQPQGNNLKTADSINSTNDSNSLTSDETSSNESSFNNSTHGSKSPGNKQSTDSNMTSFKKPNSINNRKSDSPLTQLSQQFKNASIVPQRLKNSLQNEEAFLSVVKSSETLFSTQNIIEDSEINSTASESVNKSSCPSSILPKKTQNATIFSGSSIINNTNSMISANRTKRKLYNPDDECDNEDDYETQRLEHAQSQSLKTESANVNKKKLQERLNALNIGVPSADKNYSQMKSTQLTQATNKCCPDPFMVDNDDFLPATHPTQNTLVTQTQKLAKRKFIVCSRFHRDQVVMFKNIVRKLGEFTIERNVTARTTHLVSMEPAKTLNVLKAMSRGIWILRQNWLCDSMIAEKWLEEDFYEMTEFSPLVQQLRLQREAFTKSFSHDVFIKCGPIFIADTCHPSKEELAELITLCSGEIVSESAEANILIGESPTNLTLSQVTLKEVWVLDSVFYGRCKKFKPYLFT